MQNEKYAGLSSAVGGAFRHAGRLGAGAALGGVAGAGLGATNNLPVRANASGRRDVRYPLVGGIGGAAAGTMAGEGYHRVMSMKPGSIRAAAKGLGQRALSLGRGIAKVF